MKKVLLIRALLITGLLAISVPGQDANPPDPPDNPNENASASSTSNKKPDPPAAKPKEPKKILERTDESYSSSKGITEINFNHTEERLTNNYGDWRESAINVIHKFNPRKVFYGNYRETVRFNKRDRQGMIGFYQPLDERWTLLFEANASPTHKILPKWSALAQVERSFNKSLIIKGGVRHTKFNTTNANIFNAEAEKYFGNNRAVYTFSLNALEKVPVSASHRFQYTRYYGENVNSINFSGSFGREIESLGALGTLQSDVQNFTVTGRHWIKDQFGVSYGLTLHRQGNLYSRRGLNAGIRYRF
jgi:YaiO family outer membrane protein